ncbi:MAG: transporter [Capsulimonas sp.]|jgi:sugar porter (SP) family MFS transporter|nr:transporter [Capsulimonas sp.]
MLIDQNRAQTNTSAVQVNASYVWLISIVAALGGLLFGYDWVVIGGAKPFFESFFQIKSASASGWVNSCALLGCLIGAVVAGTMSDRLGRKRLLIASALLFTVTSIGNALANSFDTFVAWRILGGVAIGLASSLSPLYISEVAPANVRGRLVAVNQLTVVVGILLAQFIDFYVVRNLPAGATDEFIRTSWYGQQGWRWMFAITAVPSILFFVCMFFVPESPRWQMTKGMMAPARETLTRIGGPAYADEIESDQAALSAQNQEKATFRDLLHPRMARVFMIGVTLAVFQQWCGINVIFNYAEDIFKAAGYDISTVLKNIAWTGSVNLLFTLVSMVLIDKGRRPLMLFGSAALAVIYCAMGFCYHAGVQGAPLLILVLGAIACYSASLAPVTWVVISEIFPNRIRGAAVAVAVSALWIASFILTFTFPILNAKLGPAGTFWLYSAICLMGFVFILRSLPETKGKTLEQLEEELVR